MKNKSFVLLWILCTLCHSSQAQQPLAPQQYLSRAATSPAVSTKADSPAQPEIAWLRSATEAAKLSQATGKPILVYVRSANCYYCDLLQKNTWQDPATRARVTREMIPLKLTLEENEQAIKAMKVVSFPSVILFSPRREYLARIDGYVTPSQFQSQIAQARVAAQPDKQPQNAKQIR